MLKITHESAGTKISSDIRKNPEVSFLLSDKSGSYFSLPARKKEQVSFYQGLVFPVTEQESWSMFKFIESLYLKNSRVSEIKNNLWNIERIGTSFEKFTMPYEKTLLYEVKDCASQIVLELDARSIYDFSTEGRIYEILGDEEQKTLKIKYTKYYDSSLQKEQYSLWLGIRFLDNNIDAEKTDRWFPKKYSYDDSRSPEKELYVYQALKLRISNDHNTRILFSVDEDEKKMMERLEDCTEKLASLLDAKKDHLEDSYGISKLKATKKDMKEMPDDVYLGYICALKSLDDLIVTIEDKTGIYAGFYWFFQFWSRDEAISIKPLILLEQHKLAKTILLRQAQGILEDGRLSNRFPYSELGSADGVGWCFMRVRELLRHLKERVKIDEVFSRDELLSLKKNLFRSIDLLLKHHTQDNLAVSGKKETWIDTSPGDMDNREGARIEIQALRLSMYKLARKLCALTGDSSLDYYKNLEEDMKRKVRENFYSEGKLADGVIGDQKDMTPRPNVFLACYIYPELLSRNEWISVFDAAIESLWLDWGGVSSIDKNSPLFQAEYTGEDNLSYHRGDSWFFVNHLAAIAMYRIEKTRYMEKINRIIKASIEEMLYSGIIGASSEVSSASALSSKGAWQQAWSCATFIELIKEVWKNG